MSLTKGLAIFGAKAPTGWSQAASRDHPGDRRMSMLLCSPKTCEVPSYYCEVHPPPRSTSKMPLTGRRLDLLIDRPL